MRGTYNNIYIIKPPPINHHRKAREIEMSVLAGQIEEMAENKGIGLIDNRTLIREMDDDIQILEDDGYHITNRAGKILADTIEAQIKDRINQMDTKDDNNELQVTVTTPRQDRMETIQLQIDAEMTRHIIGHKGKLIKEIEEATNTRIKTEDNRDRTTTTATVTATQIQHAKEAQDLIEAKINEVKSFAKEKDKHTERKAICDFYLRGNCKYGRQCYYRHDDETARREITWGRNDRSTERGRTREREPSRRRESSEFRSKMSEQRSRSRGRTNSNR